LLISKSTGEKSAGNNLTPEEEKRIEKFRNRVDTLCKKAFELDVPIMVVLNIIAIRIVLMRVVMEDDGKI